MLLYMYVSIMYYNTYVSCIMYVSYVSIIYSFRDVQWESISCSYSPSSSHSLPEVGGVPGPSHLPSEQTWLLSFLHEEQKT